MKGSYILVIELTEDREISAGKLGIINFSNGYYAYVGSALGGLQSRINRHLRQNKKIHWHIDYLLKEAYIRQIITCRTDKRIECKIAQILGSRFNSIYGFGSSDCRCRSHLFFSAENMEREIMEMLASTTLKPQLIEVPEGELSNIL